MVKSSVIIRCFNEEKHIEKLLKGLVEQTVKDIEIIVVDSGSTDGTLSIAGQYPVKIVSIKPEEFSFGRALNIGCEVAEGEFIIIASAHVYPVYSDWLENLLEPFVDPNVALVYGKQQGNEITKYSEHQIFGQWFSERSTWDQVHPFCNNANAAIRRELWLDNPYDEQLTGLEDLAWAKKVQEKGYKIAYSADATIVHVHDEPFAKIFNRYRREAIALKTIFPSEHFHFWDFIYLFVGNLISDYYHALHDGVWFANYREILIFRFMQFWGTYRGFRDRVNSQLKQTFYYPKGFNRYRRNRDGASARLIDYQEIFKEKRLEGNY